MSLNDFPIEEQVERIVNAIDRIKSIKVNFTSDNLVRYIDLEMWNGHKKSFRTMQQLYFYAGWLQAHPKVHAYLQKMSQN